jgi:hypothetical protein
VRKNLLQRLQIVKDQQDTLAKRKDTPEDVYARNMASLKNEQVDCEVQLSKIGDDSKKNEITFEQVKEVFLRANREADAFPHMNPELQREFVEEVLSNISVKGKDYEHYQFKPEYQVIADLPENATIEQLCTGQDSN